MEGAGGLLDSPLRHVLQNLVMGLSPVRAFARRWHRTGMGRDLERVLPVLAKLLVMLRGVGMEPGGRTLLELGPGKTPDLLYAAVAYGAVRALGLDVAPYLEGQDARQDELAATVHWLAGAAAEGRLPPPVSDPVPILPEVRQYDGRHLPLPDESVDIVWSKSVLEHVREPETVVGEVARVLRPGGISCHIIDLRDHLTLGTDKDWLRFLRYRPALWNLMMSNRSSWCNRLPARAWERVFTDAGLSARACEKERHSLHPAFDPQRLAAPFRDLSTDELAVAWLYLVHEKPA